MGRTIFTGKRARWGTILVALVAVGVVTATLARAESSSALCESGTQAIELDVQPREPGVPLCLSVAGADANASRVDPLYSEAVRAIVASDARLAPGGNVDAAAVCWNTDDWDLIAGLFEANGVSWIAAANGFADEAHGVISLSPRVCERLDRLVYGGERPETESFSSAVRTLIHEAIHTAGIRDEAITDCYAIQLTAQIALELGADAAYGEALTSLNWETHRKTRAGGIYDSRDCHEGGTLDLGLGATAWSNA